MDVQVFPEKFLEITEDEIRFTKPEEDFRVDVDEIPKVFKRFDMGFIWVDHPREFTYTHSSKGGIKKRVRILMNQENFFAVGTEEYDEIFLFPLSILLGYMPQGYRDIPENDPTPHAFVWKKGDPNTEG